MYAETIQFTAIDGCFYYVSAGIFILLWPLNSLLPSRIKQVDTSDLTIALTVSRRSGTKRADSPWIGWRVLVAKTDVAVEHRIHR
jgi:hypothetical protein